MDSPKPIVLHAQLTQSLLAELASGFYAVSRRFLSNRTICRLWKVSETTAKNSLANLVEEGLLEVRDRSGYYVRPGSQEKALLRLHRGPAPKLPPPLTWETKKFQLLTQREDQRRQIAVILGGKTKVPAEGMDGLPSPHLFQELDYATSLFQEARRQHCHVHFYVDTGNAARRRTIVAQILSRHPDGVIAFRRLLSYAPLQPMITPLVAANIPVVTIFDDCEQLNVASININNLAVGYDAVQRFLKLGHRRIAVVLPTLPNRYFSDRAAGARMAMAEANLSDVRLDVLRYAPNGPMPSALAERFRDPRRRPTAVLVSLVAMLPGLLPVLRQFRLTVPRDVSIIMCAGQTYLPQYKRAFDTLKIDFKQLGTQALARLLRILEGRQEERAMVLDLPYVPTGSVRRPARFHP